MVNSKLFLLLTIILLLVTPVFGSVLSTEILRSKTEITPGGVAAYTLELRNKGDTETTFSINSNQLDVHPFSESIQDIIIKPHTIKIPPRETRDVDVKIKTFESVPPNQRIQTMLTITAVTNPELKVRIPLEFRLINPPQLTIINTDLPDDITISKEKEFTVTVEPSVNILIKNATVKIISELFEDEFTTPLIYDVKISKKILLDIPTSTTPGQYTLQIKVVTEKEELGNYKKTFQIIKNPDITEQVQKKNSFFKKEITMVKTNDGNLAVEEKVRIPLNRFEQTFAVATPAPTAATKNYFEWAFELKPGEYQEIVVKVDFRSFVVGVVLVIALIIFIVYFFTRKITIKKELYSVTREKDGITEIKIKLIIRNKLGNIPNVKIVDFLPHLMSPTPEFGTLKPEKIQKAAQGIRLTWGFGNLAPGEERVLTYKVHSKVHIVGTIKLPPAAVLYSNKNKRLQTKSNRLYLTAKKNE
ncbi:MAG: hypothetical protein AABW49_04280 [Nanoarchaeota archaeon]